jgi:hypothetical protein
MALWGKQDAATPTGTSIDVTNGSAAVTGTGTTFLADVDAGDTLIIGTTKYKVLSITSNTALTLTSNFEGSTATLTISSAPVRVQQSPKNLSLADKRNTYGVDATEAQAGGDNVVDVNVAVAGARYLEVPAVTFSGGGGSSAAATATISGGAVTAITVTNVGSSYTSTPTVVVDKPRRTIPTSGITTATDTIAYNTHGLNAADVLVYNNGGGSSATGLTSGTTYYVISSGLTANAFKVSATDGGSAVDITGTGNNAQYFEIQATANQATAVADLGSGEPAAVMSPGWVLRTEGTGGRAGRIQYETLVAGRSLITGDAADDIEFPDS